MKMKNMQLIAALAILTMPLGSFAETVKISPEVAKQSINSNNQKGYTKSHLLWKMYDECDTTRSKVLPQLKSLEKYYIAARSDAKQNEGTANGIRSFFDSISDHLHDLEVVLNSSIDIHDSPELKNLKEGLSELINDYCHHFDSEELNAPQFNDRLIVDLLKYTDEFLTIIKNTQLAILAALGVDRNYVGYEIIDECHGYATFFTKGFNRRIKLSYIDTLNHMLLWDGYFNESDIDNFLNNPDDGQLSGLSFKDHKYLTLKVLIPGVEKTIGGVKEYSRINAKYDDLTPVEVRSWLAHADWRDDLSAEVHDLYEQKKLQEEALKAKAKMQAAEQPETDKFEESKTSQDVEAEVKSFMKLPTLEQFSVEDLRNEAAAAASGMLPQHKGSVAMPPLAKPSASSTEIIVK